MLTFALTGIDLYSFKCTVSRPVSRVLLLGHVLDREGAAASGHGTDGEGHYRELSADGGDVRVGAERRPHLLHEAVAAAVPAAHDEGVHGQDGRGRLPAAARGHLREGDTGAWMN